MSPRPKKLRHCEGNFCGRAFKPTGTPLTELHQVDLHRDELEALAKDKGVADRVRFLGWRTDRAALLQAADPV